MKTIALVVLCVLTLGLSGCDPGSRVQRILDKSLPPGYVGDAKIEHKNPYIDLTVTLTNVRKVEGLWTWDKLEYHRNGRFSHGIVTLGGPR